MPNDVNLFAVQSKNINLQKPISRMNSMAESGFSEALKKY